MKNIKYLLTLILFLCIGFNVKAITYNVGEYVYYDPYNHRSCNTEDYWTIYNSESTCYRWAVIQTGLEEQSFSAIRLLLDHDIAVGTYAERASLYTEEINKWNDDNILKATTLGNNMILGLYKITLENSDKINELSRANPNSISFIYTNTNDYSQGKRYYNGGYWISHSSVENNAFEVPGETRAYYVTENGDIKLIDTKDANGNPIKKGIRPTIYIKESALSNSSYENEEIELSDVIANGSDSKLMINYSHGQEHEHKNYNLNTNRYFYPQGFNFYDENNFMVYLTHRVIKEGQVEYTDTNAPGILLKYENKQFNYKGSFEFGHGNDMSSTAVDNFYVSNSASKTIEFWQLNNGIYELSETLELGNDKKIFYSVFTLDSDQKYLYGINSDRRVLIRDIKNNYALMYSFHFPILETLQSMDYNNGYLYITTYNSPKQTDNSKIICTEATGKSYCYKSCDDSAHQLYCYGDDRSSTIYVYNVKIDANGNPSKFFGQLVKKYTTNNINKRDNSKHLFYEVESIGANGNNLFLGYARRFYKDTTVNPLEDGEVNNVVVPVAYKYPQKYNSLTYKKGNQNTHENILDGTHTDIKNPFTYAENEEFLGWLNDEGKIISDSIVKVNQNVNLNSVYVEFDKKLYRNKNIIKTSLNKNLTDFNSNIICHNCSVNISSNNEKFISTGDTISIYANENKKKEYQVIIKGDVTGTGTSNVSDVAKLYQYLKGKIDIESCYIEAGNVVSDDSEIKINDVAMLYQFIKGKINSLE